MKVKICGITGIGDADYAIKSGADFIGVILDPKVGRHGSQELIKEIKTEHPASKVVGVYTSMPEQAGYEDYIQLHFIHSAEEVEFARERFHKNVISVIDFHEEHIRERIASHIDAGAEYVLLEDRTGIAKRKEQLIEFPLSRIGIAGKIDSNNIGELLETHPDLIDVSSSLEEYIGKKSYQKMDIFFRKIGEYHVVRQNQ